MHVASVWHFIYKHAIFFLFLKLYLFVTLSLPSTDSKPIIRRRHSLHSPTGDPRPLLKHLSTAHSRSLSRPSSMLLDLSDNVSYPEQEQTDLNANDSTIASFLVPPLDSKTMTDKSRSYSNQNIAASGGFSQNFLTAAPHLTCSGSLAFSTSPLHCAPSTMNSMMSMCSSSRPTLITQLSQAGSSVADSPSPVERDGVLSTSSNTSNSDAPQRTTKTSATSKHSELKSLDFHAHRMLDSRRTEYYATNDNSNVGTQVEKAPRLVSNMPHYLSSSPHHANLSLHKQPYHSLSNPEFPLATTRICVNSAERTHSYDDLYATRKKPPFHPPSDKVSPSREKINNLSSHICSTLDQNWAETLSTCASGSCHHHLLKDTSLSSGSSPVCEVMQKIINGTTPLLKFNQAHIRTLMEISSSGFNPSGHEDYVLVGAPSSMMTISCGSSFAEAAPIQDSLVSYLTRLGYKLIEKPLHVQFSIPLEGYMTLTFKILGEDLHTKDALLKVCKT